MNLRIAAVLLVAIAAGMLVWRSELFTVARPGDRPRALDSVPVARRTPARFDAMLPAVPAGSQRVTPAGDVLVVHYWAPWERHSGAQARALDSLSRALPPGVRLVVVCFDPFPSVARYLGRMRLRLPVLLDHKRLLSRDLPCRSVPYTYVIDRAGRIATEQAGEVDWLAPRSLRTMSALAEERDATPAPAL